MTRLPALSYAQLKKKLIKLGYQEVPHRGKGSHRQFLPYDPSRPPLTVPYDKSIAKGTLRNIIRDTGLTVDEFIRGTRSPN